MSLERVTRSLMCLGGSGRVAAHHREPAVGLRDEDEGYEAEDDEQDAEGDDDDGPPWLVYLLDHQYSEQSIDWSRLKNADRVRSSALLEAAQRLDCDCFLALADVHEAYELDSDEDDEDEAWTGNEGGTAEKWYRQAALVMIPRKSHLHAEVAEPEGSERPPREAPRVRRRRRRT